MKNNNKKAIYESFGIEYKGGKIYAPLFGWIAPLLVNGNAKLGKGVWTWSMLPGTGFYHATINGDVVETKGTCLCDCVGCYAKTGFFNMPSVINSLVIKTALARMYPEFVKRAIMAQIVADNIELLRIHAAGDFFNDEYVELWRDIVRESKATRFWTYTKNKAAETAFDEFENANIVKSLYNGRVNFGHAGAMVDLYHALVKAGKKVYICRCGIDKNQHCTNCRGCAEYEYVLFLEHSTSYNPINDERYPEFIELVNSLDKSVIQ